MQHSEQYRQQLEENYKNHVQNKIKSINGIIAATPSESADLSIAYNDLLNDEDAPVSIEQNQSSNANHNIGELNNNKRDMINDDIENQMNAPMQEMVNDDGEFTYKYMECLQFDLTQKMLNKITFFCIICRL